MTHTTFMELIADYDFLYIVSLADFSNALFVFLGLLSLKVAMSIFWLTKWFKTKQPTLSVSSIYFRLHPLWRLGHKELLHGRQIEQPSKYFQLKSSNGPELIVLYCVLCKASRYLYYKMKLSVCISVCMYVCMYPNISRNTARTALKQTPKIR